MALRQTLARSRTATVASPGALDELVARLAEVDLYAAAAVSIESLFGATRIDDASLAPFVHFLPGKYTRNCVFRDERFELLVLCWAQGSRSPIHDHGGSRCFVKVQRGSLDVENFSIVEGGRAAGRALLVPGETQIMRAGDVDARTSSEDVHRVAALGAAAISLHVYARPLDRCLVFDLARQSCKVAVNAYTTGPR